MKNSINDLRNHLFEVIERLKDAVPGQERPLDVEVAEAICLAAKRLIETAEVEIKFREAAGLELAPSDFLNLPRVAGGTPVAKPKKLGNLVD